MRRVKAMQAERLQKLVELEFKRFVDERSMIRSQQAIDSFAIEKTKASTQLFLNVLTEPEIITLLGGRIHRNERDARDIGTVGVTAR